MRRDEHTPVYMCKICGQPKVTHLLGYQHEFVPEVFVDPVLTKISLDCMTMNLDPPPTDWDLRHLKHAEQVADSSKDPSTKVGSVIIDAKRRVLGVGYNGFPRGILDSPERLGDRDVKYSLMVHAELNAILNSGDVTRLEGATLYSSLFPCNECAKSIIQVGITRVVTRISSIDRWRESNGAAAKMFREAGVEVVER